MGFQTIVQKAAGLGWVGIPGAMMWWRGQEVLWIAWLSAVYVLTAAAFAWRCFAR